MAAAVASGYLLGRRRRLRLAIVVGGMIAGKKISTNPRQLLSDVQRLVESNPQLAGLVEQIETQLIEAARTAAVKVATDRVNHLSESLQGQTEQLQQIAEDDSGGAEDESESDTEGEESGENSSDEKSADQPDEDESDSGGDADTDDEDSAAKSKSSRSSKKRKPSTKKSARGSSSGKTRQSAKEKR